MFFKKFFVGVLLVFGLSNSAHAQYTEKPTSPTNLVQLLHSDFTASSWVNIENLIAIHGEDFYLLGLLTDYAVLKEMSNNSVGTDFSYRDNIIKMYHIYQNIGSGEKELFEQYDEAIHGLSGTGASLSVPVLNYLANLYGDTIGGGVPSDLIGNSYGRFTSLLAVSDVITSIADTHKLSTIESLTNLAVTIGGTGGAVAGAYTNILFGILGSMEKNTLKNRTYLYAALYFKSVSFNQN